MAKYLAVYDSIDERLFGVDPANATGVPIPAFKSGPALPAVGTLDGEAFLNTTTGVASVWNGNVWSPIVPTNITIYPRDADVMADTGAAPGAYGAAQDTGNFYFRTGTGWRVVGIRAYTTQADLEADTPADGAVGLALDTNNLMMRAAGAWQPMGIVHYATFAELTAATPPDGSTAVEASKGIMYIRAAGGWYPKTPWLGTESGILGWNTDVIDGQMAIATDTGHMYVRNGGAWIGSPIVKYPTDADLLAATPKDGVIGLAMDSGDIRARVGGNWVRPASGAHLYEGQTAPSAPVVGDLWFDTRSNALRVRTAANNWSLAVNFSHGTTIPGGGIVDGAMFFNDATKEASIHVPGGWQAIGTSMAKVYTQQNNNIQQMTMTMTPHPKKRIRFQLNVFVKTAAQLQLIGQTSGAWWDLSTKVNGSLTRKYSGNNALHIDVNPHTTDWKVDGAKLSTFRWAANQWVYVKGDLVMIDADNGIMNVELFGSAEGDWRRVEIGAHFSKSIWPITFMGFKVSTGTADFSLAVEAE